MLGNFEDIIKFFAKNRAIINLDQSNDNFTHRLIVKGDFVAELKQIGADKITYIKSTDETFFTVYGIHKQVIHAFTVVLQAK